MRRQDLHGLYAEHARDLFGFLAYRVGDRTVAEDLLSDVFERALRAHRSFDRKRGSEKAWLYTIALNCLRDHLRHAGAERRAIERHASELPSAEDTEQQLVGVSDRDMIGRALQRISADERDVIALRYGADMRLAEIAETIGEPRTTVEARLYRGLRKLQQQLEPEPDELQRELG
ncbi:MAG: RNA polymerase sigma factor [Solirubrobacteraceae bacterium]